MMIQALKEEVIVRMFFNFDLDHHHHIEWRAFLFLLASNTRYRRVIDALSRTPSTTVEPKLEALIARLPAASRADHEALRARIERIMAIYAEGGSEYFLAPDNEHNLRHLAWLHLKLLLAREHLLRGESETPLAAIQSQIATQQAAIAATTSAPARDSKTATLRILEERLATAQARAVKLEEVNADLHRIGNQVELVLEKATLQANPTEVAFTIDLASQSLDSDFSGSSAAEDIRAMDSYFLERA
jgi:hypothetical protein